MTPVPLAVVGVGHLGKEHARILSGLPGVELVGVVDPNVRQAEAVAQRCNTQAFPSHHPLLDRVRGVVIAAPTRSHFAIARDCLSRGIAVLIEKPITANLTEAREIVALADKHLALVQVGHIERFNPAFEELQSSPICPRYLRTERCCGFTGRSTDVGVVLDLMIHDLDLVLTLVQAPVSRVEAIGVAVLGGYEDMAQARVTFTNGAIADLSASRLHPEVKRTLHVWGAEGYVGIDFASRKVTLMQPALPLRQGKIDSRQLDPVLMASLKAELFGQYIQTIELDTSKRHRTDQLTRELEEFVSCVRTGSSPRVDGRAGMDALDLASRVLDSLRAQPILAPAGWLFSPMVKEAA
jgi:predicted dehydrogenase